MNQERGFSMTDLVVCVVLAAATLIAYLDVSNFEFVSYDDPLYVSQNTMVQKGLTFDGVVWAFKTGHANNWNPVTWISHMVDHEIHGSDPQGHHMMSLLFHVANSLLLYAFLKILTGATWRSAIVAALFALHPLHVESVAWVSDRKGLLSTLFMLLSCLAYVRYARKGGAAAYAGALALLALGLLVKPMLVTLPFVFLLLDMWPLDRFKGNTRTVLLEKIPFFLVIAASSAVTYLVQQQTGAVRTYEELSLLSRIANAPEAYVLYIAKTFVPVNLAFFYPHPAESIPLWRATLALGALVIASLAAVAIRKKQPFFFVGWFWFVGTLVPVIGIIQIGRQALADRFSYVPLIGLFIALTWGISLLIARFSSSKLPGAIVAAGVLAACVGITRAQVETWRDDDTLYRHAIEVTDDNFIAHSMLANHLMAVQKYAEAKNHYLEARRIFPAEPRILINLGIAHLELKEISLAEEVLEEAFTHYPDHASAHMKLARALIESDRIAEAEKHLREVVRIEPGNYQARYNLGVMLRSKGEYAEAATQFAAAAQIDPEDQAAKQQLRFCRSQLEK